MRTLAKQIALGGMVTAWVLFGLLVGNNEWSRIVVIESLETNSQILRCSINRLWRSSLDSRSTPTVFRTKLEGPSSTTTPRRCKADRRGPIQLKSTVLCGPSGGPFSLSFSSFVFFFKQREVEVI